MLVRRAVTTKRRSLARGALRAFARIVVVVASIGLARAIALGDGRRVGGWRARSNTDGAYELSVTRIDAGARATRYAGKSGALVMRGTDGRGRSVILKAWCGVRGGFRQVAGADVVPETCDEASSREPDRVLAVQGLISSMGFGRFVPRAAVRTVSFDTPTDTLSSGAEQRVRALVMDVAEGKPIDELGDDASASEDARNTMTKQMYDVLMKVKREDILSITLLDFVLGNRDRNVYNIYTTTSGKLTLIDNADVFDGDHTSVVTIPGTSHHFYFLGGYASEKDKKCYGGRANESVPECVKRVENYPMTVGAILDYRCWVKDGFIGWSFPPRFATFLAEASRRLHGQTEEEINFLQRRAELLRKHGFEGALKIVLSESTIQHEIKAPCCDPLGCDWPVAERLSRAATKSPSSGATGPLAGNHENLSEAARAFMGSNDARSVVEFLDIIHHRGKAVESRSVDAR